VHTHTRKRVANILRAKLGLGREPSSRASWAIRNKSTMRHTLTAQKLWYTRSTSYWQNLYFILTNIKTTWDDAMIY